MKDHPSVSIIMAAFNAGKYVNAAIISVVNQYYTDWELLIINDGSTDNTESLVSKFQDTRIRYFKQPNKGVSAARNIGLENMQGDFFCFLDADDVMPPESLKVRINKFHKNPGINFVDGYVSVRDRALVMEISLYKPTIKGKIFDHLVRLDTGCYFGPSWMIKRDRSKTYKMIEGLSHAEDLCFYLALAKEGNYDFVDEEILWYRKGHTSAMSNVKGLEKGYSFYYTYAKSLGAKKKDLNYLKWRLRRIIFLSYIFDNNSPWSAFKSLFNNYR